MELLGVLSDRHGALPIAICVSSRDELDAVCAAVANLPFVSSSPLVCSVWLAANFNVEFCLSYSVVALVENCQIVTSMIHSLHS